MVKDFEQRAAAVFQRAHENVHADIRAMHADHSARGLLRSGNTVRRAVHIFEERTREAVKQLQSEAANVMDHRGHKWTSAMAAIERALEEEVAGARTLLAPSFTVATAAEGSANEAGLKLINEAGARLRSEHAAFRDGWTAPPGKPWRERNALFYALILLLAGAAIGEAVKLGSNLFSVHPSRPQKPR